ncbi:hypothetical protein GVN24_25195 [Rhizobium sp. CRIBSB]|nr:hypothetical protein [Rhizobium sp. CRIBSB]
MKLDNEVLRFAIDLINYADPDPTGLHMVMAEDLLEHWRPDKAHLQRALHVLTEVLEGEAFSGSELKGLLNRASGKCWGTEYSRSFTPVEFVAELKRALENYLRHSESAR